MIRHNDEMIGSTPKSEAGIPMMIFSTQKSFCGQQNQTSVPSKNHRAHLFKYQNSHLQLSSRSFYLDCTKVDEILPLSMRYLGSSDKSTYKFNFEFNALFDCLKNWEFVFWKILKLAAKFNFFEIFRQYQTSQSVSVGSLKGFQNLNQNQIMIFWTVCIY